MSESPHHTPPETEEVDLLPEDAFTGEKPILDVDLGSGSTEAKIVEYAPGQYAAVLGEEAIPRYGVVRWQHVGKNQWRPQLVGWGRHISLRRFFRPSATGNEPHPLLARLGLDLCYNSVLRLYKNGFITGSMPVPHRILIDIESLSRHLKESSDPDFWTEERIKRYKETIY